MLDTRHVVSMEISLDPAEWETPAATAGRVAPLFGGRLRCEGGREAIVGVRRSNDAHGDLSTLEIVADRFVPGQTIAGARRLALTAGPSPPPSGATGRERGRVDLRINGTWLGTFGAADAPPGPDVAPDRRGDKAAPAAAGARVVINEVLANTPGGNDIEYVELFNAGSAAQDLSGWYLLDDDDAHDSCPLVGTLAAGAYLVVPGIRARVEARFPGLSLNDNQFDSLVAGVGFGLGNGEDIVRLYRDDPDGDELIDVLTYGRQGADIAFGYRPHDADAAEYLAVPTPGIANDVAALHSPICINEFLTTSLTGGVDDWVELYNRGDVAVDISGWFLSDDAGTPLRYAFPAGTVIPAGGYLTVDEVTLGFSFSSTGSEVLLLTHADGETGQDYYDFGPQFADVSQGRFPDGSPDWHFFVEPSSGTANTCAAGPSPPAPVTGLVFVAADALSWASAPGADAYDVVVGDLIALRDARGDFSAAVGGCAGNNRTDRPVPASPLPAAGDALFYLVRGVHFACGFGTYDSGFGSQAAGRDTAVASTPVACP